MVELTSIEIKLLRLMLDSGAQPGEVSASSLKLAESLRKRGVSAQDIEESLSESANGNGNGAPPKMWKPDYGLCVMPFGRTKGQRFMDIAPYDLRSARRWAMSKPDLEQKFSEFIHDVEEFLKQ
jgi:hypothetical protein